MAEPSGSADSPAAAPPARPRVAILIVNGFARRGPRGRQRAAEALAYPWIELCLSQLARHSRDWDYEVSVFDNSHLVEHRQLMRSFEHVTVRPGNRVAALGRMANAMPGPYLGRLLERRHPLALDHLARRVSAERDYIITLDNDSFPVRDDWLDVLVTPVRRGAAVSGVYRDEMAPAIEPFVHVSGLCVGRRDLLDLGVSFGRDLPDAGEISERAGEHNQDVGQRITYAFIERGREIAPLKRSNAVNYHRVMGGLYGDVIYHHGAGGRRARFHSPGRADANERIGARLRDAAFEDVDHLMAILRGQAPGDLGLAAL